MGKRIGRVIVGATLVVAHCLLGGVAFAQLQDDGQPCPPECVTDSMEIVTWYPSPYNEYEELRLYPISDSNSQCNSDTRGLMYYDSDEDKVKLCKGPAGLNNWQDLGGGGYWDVSPSNSNDIYYTPSGNVGIGTDTPQAKVHIVKNPGAGSIASGVTTTFSYTGAVQIYTVPVDVVSITIDAYGAQGGGNGGNGGRVKANIPVAPGETLSVYVGGNNGFNGGGAAGNNGGSRGGDASDVRRGSERIIVAAGGGGSAGCNNTGSDGAGGCNAGGSCGSPAGSGKGGAGGYQNGYDGIRDPCSGAGKGATQVLGGAGGAPTGGSGYSANGGAGGLGTVGGCGGNNGGGGGGGGYYGGGGGGADNNPCSSTRNGSGGGGGSGYTISSANSILFEDASHSGNGLVRITPAATGEVALYVEGILNVSGSKNFIIPHPSKPGMKLVHSSLEGPEVGVYYRGEAQLDNGQAVIILPDYFEALTSAENRTVLITPIGGGSVLYVEDGVKDGKFVVKTADSAKNDQKFFWMVQAVRKDIPPLVVEKED